MKTHPAPETAATRSDPPRRVAASFNQAVEATATSLGFEDGTVRAGVSDSLRALRSGGCALL
jgi:hypothetical protein